MNSRKVPSLVPMIKRLADVYLPAIVLSLCLGRGNVGDAGAPLSVSGVYPEFAAFNSPTNYVNAECGIGGVVHWADRLWYLSYRDADGDALWFGQIDDLWQLSHQSTESVQFTLKIDFTANGSWHTFKTFTVPAGEILKYEFPEGFSAHWLRMIGHSTCTATSQLIYE